MSYILYTRMNSFDGRYKNENQTKWVAYIYIWNEAIKKIPLSRPGTTRYFITLVKLSEFYYNYAEVHSNIQCFIGLHNYVLTSVAVVSNHFLKVFDLLKAIEGSYKSVPIKWMLMLVVSYEEVGLIRAWLQHGLR